VCYDGGGGMLYTTVCMRKGERENIYIVILDSLDFMLFPYYIYPVLKLQIWTFFLSSSRFLFKETAHANWK